jgi:hypothetical protein
MRTAVLRQLRRALMAADSIGCALQPGAMNTLGPNDARRFAHLRNSVKAALELTERADEPLVEDVLGEWSTEVGETVVA